MCNCVQKSKTPLAPGKGFHYKFECTTENGEVKKIELDASNDNIAKQLAEDACQNGFTYLSFEDTDALMKSLNIPSLTFDENQKANSANLTENIITLNPKSWTKLAQYGSGRGCEIKLSGRWVPGSGHPSWDANGSSNHIFKGTHKWCAVIQIHVGTEVYATIPWPSVKPGFLPLGYYGFPTAVIVFMNDDKYDDNSQDTNNPMTASVRLT